MEINFRFLNRSKIAVIHQTMMKAFSDYPIDMSYMTLERFKSRAVLARVDFNFSVGAYADDKMVGFTNVGIDFYKGALSAYDAGTGIIKEFRGRGIAGKMFDFIIPKLKEKGVQKFYLEVLQENKPAISAYEKSGFKIERKFNCYKVLTEKLKPQKTTIPNVSISPIKNSEVLKYEHFLNQEIAWESNFNAMKHTSDKIINLGAYKNGKCIGIISFYPTLEWILFMGTDKNQKTEKIESLLLNSLLEKIKDTHQIIKMGNLVPENPQNKFLLDKGFELYATQFEMACQLI